MTAGMGMLVVIVWTPDGTPAAAGPFRTARTALAAAGRLEARGWHVDLCELSRVEDFNDITGEET